MCLRSAIRSFSDSVRCIGNLPCSCCSRWCRIMLHEYATPPTTKDCCGWMSPRSRPFRVLFIPVSNSSWLGDCDEVVGTSAVLQDAALRLRQQASDWPAGVEDLVRRTRTKPLFLRLKDFDKTVFPCTNGICRCNGKKMVSVLHASK